MERIAPPSVPAPHIYQPHDVEGRSEVPLEDGGGVSLFKKVTIPAQFWIKAQITTQADAEPILKREADALCSQQGYVLDKVERVAQEADGAWSIYVLAHKSRLAFGSRDPLDGHPVASTADMLRMLNRHGRRSLAARKR